MVPLNPVRVFAAAPNAVCDAVLEVLSIMELELASDTRQDNACLIESDVRRLSESGPPVNHLRDVAYVGNQNFFSHGRFAFTVAVGQNSAGNTRVRITTRVEGYDAGYQNLRSTGLLESTAFDHLTAELGESPISS